MKKVFLLLALSLTLLVSCSFVPIGEEKCSSCGKYYSDIYCPVYFGDGCPDCIVKYGETCARCGADCCYHYVEFGNDCTFLCYSCAEDLLNDPSVYNSVKLLLGR